VARLHSRRLDFSKPPWEVYVIEGLDNVEGVPPGSFALYSKMHHCAADGELGTAIIKALHTLTPTHVDDYSVPEVHATADREPTHFELYSGPDEQPKVPAVTPRRQGGRAGKFGFTTLGSPRALWRLPDVLRDLLRRPWHIARVPPETRFGDKITVHRVFEAVSIPLEDFKLVRRHVPEATVNDQFMAIVGGALREYLESKGELPDDSMIAAVPMSLRGTTSRRQPDRSRSCRCTRTCGSSRAPETIAAESQRRAVARRARQGVHARPSRRAAAPLTDAIARFVRLRRGLVVSASTGPTCRVHGQGTASVTHRSSLLDGSGSTSPATATRARCRFAPSRAARYPDQRTAGCLQQALRRSGRHARAETRRRRSRPAQAAPTVNGRAARASTA
jgi:hypothetical protein